jgi:hypothetical protein
MLTIAVPFLAAAQACCKRFPAAPFIEHSPSRECPDTDPTAGIMLSMSLRDKPLWPQRGDTTRSTPLLGPAVAADRGIEAPNTEGVAVISEMASA